MLVAACHPSASTPTPERCRPAVPPGAQHPLAARTRTLAGDYELIQVETQPTPGSSSVGRLHLAIPDSAAQVIAVGGAARDLIGWLEVIRGDTVSRPGASSRDPASPGAVLAGNHLRLGLLAMDAPVEHLEITAVSRDGFWGWWKAQPGWEVTVDSETQRVLPDPAGYFCALRVNP
jgi:hypothetical protein